MKKKELFKIVKQSLKEVLKEQGEIRPQDDGREEGGERSTQHTTHTPSTPAAPAGRPAPLTPMQRSWVISYKKEVVDFNGPASDGAAACSFVPASLQLRSSFAPASLQLGSGFAPASHQLRSSFAPGSLQDHSSPSFAPALPQLCSGFAAASPLLRPRFAGEAGAPAKLLRS